MLVSFPVSSFLLLSKFFVGLQLNTSFNQRLTVLSPDITDQKFKVFRAQWASMHGRVDFENLNREMDVIAMQKNITLPKLLID